MKKWGKLLIASIMGAAMLAPGMVSEAQMPGRIGIPNPLVEYNSYERLGQVVGFDPLFLTESFGYKVDDYIAISRETADIRYSNDKGAKLMVRSEKMKQSEAAKDISGVYTGKWEEKRIGNAQVYVAKTGSHSFAAHWTTGGYAFAVTGEGMNEKEFNHLLTGYFVDITDHYYSNRAVPLM